MNPEPRAFATCPKGLESLLLEEVSALGATTVKETVAGVAFGAERACVYRICMWSRLANRVLLRIASFPFDSEAGLYEGARTIPWHEYFALESTFAVDLSGAGGGISDTRFGALRVKDAIVDRFRDETGQRPDVNTATPDFRVNVRLRNNEAVLSLDLSGESLHRRGYRTSGGPATLKENLASALLLRANWPSIAAEGGALIDPLCGSGTLLIEACQMAMDIAPGLGHARWGFEHWLDHVPRLWRDVVEEAQARQRDSAAREGPDLVGYDASMGAILSARQNIAEAGFAERIKVYQKPLEELVRPTHKPFRKGLVISNPPYGVRLGDEVRLATLYRSLGAKLREQFPGWKAAVITGNPALGKTMGIRARKQYNFFNGTIPARLLLFDVEPAYFVRSSSAATGSDAALSKGAQMFANRLRKNVKRLRKWRDRSAIECYRIYDADMPEYAVAIDRYGDWVHIAEYRAPAAVERAAAEQRLRDVLLATSDVLEVPSDRLVLKERRRQRGTDQYTRESARSKLIEVTEGSARLLVNLHDYLDTGLFLDHRPLRRKLAELARGTRFLNLFCYTGTATVHAALGGARESVSVDLSATYLDWTQKNLRLNDIDLSRHKLERAECSSWLTVGEDLFDLILLDPPTFSNSKRMTQTFDVQRDHADLLDAAMNRLTPTGVLVFSTNRQKFALDDTIAQRYELEDITGWSVDLDFARARNRHHAWFVRKK